MKIRTLISQQMSASQLTQFHSEPVSISDVEDLIAVVKDRTAAPPRRSNALLLLGTLPTAPFYDRAGEILQLCITCAGEADEELRARAMLIELAWVKTRLHFGSERFVFVKIPDIRRAVELSIETGVGPENRRNALHLLKVIEEFPSTA